jgi:hypothetical protein
MGFDRPCRRIDLVARQGGLGLAQPTRDQDLRALADIQQAPLWPWASGQIQLQLAHAVDCRAHRLRASRRRAAAGKRGGENLGSEDELVELALVESVEVFRRLASDGEEPESFVFVNR